MPVLQYVLANRLPFWALAASTTSMPNGEWLDDVQMWFVQHWDEFIIWAFQRHVVIAFLAWVITFTLICIIVLGLGFGPMGIIAGSLAAIFQSWAYGAWTPAGGIFATLTSMAMIGTLMPPLFIGAATIASLVTVIVWLCGVGRADSLALLAFEA